MTNLCLLVEETVRPFPKVLRHLNSQQQCMTTVTESSWPHTLKPHSCPFGDCTEGSHYLKCNSNLHFSCESQSWKLFMYYLVIYIFFCNLTVQIFCPFLKFTCFLYWWVVRFLYILDINPLTNGLNIFSQAMTLMIIVTVLFNFCIFMTLIIYSR